MTDKIHQVAIVGGGVCGTALLYMLAEYTDINDIVLIEKYDGVAKVNSHSRNNSQTIHCGDIETNYSLEKATKVKAAAQMLVNFAKRLPDASKIIFKYPKMVHRPNGSCIETSIGIDVWFFGEPVMVVCR